MEKLTPEVISAIFDAQKKRQAAVRVSDADARREKLEKLRAAILNRQEEITTALHQDFRKPPAETLITEIFATLSEIKFAIKNVKGWMKPRRVSTPLEMFGSSAELRYEPKGVALIVGPWNYPFSLTVCPLAAAIAAGNCAIIKPSELTPYTSDCIARIVADCFPPEEIVVLQGGVELSTDLLARPFDHIFFTGSIPVGKIVMEAAAKNLASVTLELGGKSPAIVDETADLSSAAARLAWGKFINGGQTCIAPDYILAQETIADDLVEYISYNLDKAYGGYKTDEQTTPDLSRIINQKNFLRLKQLCDASVAQGATITRGGDFIPEENFISPTILTNVEMTMPIMGEEIFGPILPVIKYKYISEALEKIASIPKPLAFYIFSSEPARVEGILANSTAGATVVNNTLIHVGNPHVPFGGVGYSGMGKYHGFFGFETFSNLRPVLRQGWPNLLQRMYPPYTSKVLDRIKQGIRIFG